MLWVWRMKIFLMKINVSAYALENSSHIFSSCNVNTYFYFSKNDKQILSDIQQKDIYFKLRKCRAKFCVIYATFPSPNVHLPKP